MGNCISSSSCIGTPKADVEPAATEHQGSGPHTGEAPRARSQRHASPQLEGLPARRPLPPLTASELSNPAIRSGANRWLASTAARPMVEARAFQAIAQRFDPARAGAASMESPRLPAVEVVDRLCKHNLDVLTKQLGTLSPPERCFLQALKDAPWHLTHATPMEFTRQNEVHLMSQDKLEKNGLSSGPQLNAIDVGQYGNSHYVFFSLEAGEALQKKASRFGDHLYRVPLKGSGVEEHGVLVLHDLALPEINADKHYPDTRPSGTPDSGQGWNSVLQHWKRSGLHDSGGDAPSRQGEPSQTQGANLHHGNIPDRCFFSGDAALDALGLAVILSARMVSEEQQSQVLSTDTENVNKAANGIFRPQILVPNEFLTDHATRHDITRHMG